MVTAKQLLPSKQIAGKSIEMVIALVIATSMISLLVTNITTAQAQLSATESTILGLIVTVFVAGLLFFVGRSFGLFKN